MLSHGEVTRAEVMLGWYRSMIGRRIPARMQHSPPASPGSIGRVACLPVPLRWRVPITLRNFDTLDDFKSTIDIYIDA
jgi:hypothetical protein